MRVLVLGGSGFLGHHVVAEAVRAGHEVTAFNRDGSVDVEGVEVLEGDRGGDLRALRGRAFDACLDSFSDPDAVRATGELLRGQVRGYAFVSGISIYHPDGPDEVDEDAPLRFAGDPAAEDDPLQERSLAKLACEAALREALDPAQLLVVRPGIMVGPRDPSDRFTHWPLRFLRALREERARRVLVPGDLDRDVQHTDARDLAAWIVARLAGEAAPGGTFDAVGPGREEPLRAVLAACEQAARDVAATSGSIELVARSEADLREALRDVEEEARPLWFPEAQIPFARVDSSRALAAGLAFRPVLQTARETLAWALERGGELDLDLPLERELELLA